MSDLLRIGGLWKSKTKKGETILSGSLNPITQLLIMPNTLKKNEKDPDFYLYMKAREKAPADKPQANKDELDF
jgi:uncharacterized protein (DUF736 family)